MARKFLFFSLLLFLFFGLVSANFALEKVKLGTATKMGATIYPTVLTAEQRGFWKENGLEVEWVAFQAAAPLVRAAATGVLNIGLAGAETPMAAAEKGVPVILVAEYISGYPFYVWVRADSPYRKPGDLKGAKVGVDTLGGTTHALARIVAKANGMEKDVRFVGTGGIGPTVASLKVGAIDATVYPLSSFVRLKLEGTVRQIGSTADYLPKPWVHYTIFARKDFTQSKPDVVRKVIKAALQANDFITKSPRWTMDLMKSNAGYPEEGAKLVYEALQYNLTGKIDYKGVENARRLYIEYGFLTEKAPPVDELFTNEYLP